MNITYQVLSSLQFRGMSFSCSNTCVDILSPGPGDTVTVYVSPPQRSPSDPFYVWQTRYHRGQGQEIQSMFGRRETTAIKSERSNLYLADEKSPG
jgi:hypothetical protein